MGERDKILFSLRIAISTVLQYKKIVTRLYKRQHKVKKKYRKEFALESSMKEYEDVLRKAKKMVKIYQQKLNEYDKTNKG